MSLKNQKNFKKMLGKSPASNAWAAIFKNADYCWSSIKVFLSKFLIKDSFLSSLLMIVPSSVGIEAK